MRIGLVWLDAAPLTRISVRYERFVHGFRRLGHDPITVCVASAAEGYAEPVVLAPDAAAMSDPAFYRGLNLDATVVITWLVYPKVVAALKAACPWVVSAADSDGKVGERVFPGATFVRSVWQHHGLADRLRAVKFWAQRYLLSPEVFDRPMLESAERADLISIGSVHAKEYLSRFFVHYRRSDLASKLALVPYPVDACFLTGEVSRFRSNHLVAVGRWDDPQKDAPMLAATLKRVLAVRPDVSCRLVGRGAGEVFGPLCAAHPQVRYLGVQPPEAVAGLLHDSRILLTSSRWEGAPVVFNEALCQGCTLVGPDSVVSLESFCQDKAFGTLSRGRSAGALASAALDELRAWDGGERDPAAIAAHWRPRCDPAAVCQQFLPPVQA